MERLQSQRIQGSVATLCNLQVWLHQSIRVTGERQCSTWSAARRLQPAHLGRSLALTLSCMDLGKLSHLSVPDGFFFFFLKGITLAVPFLATYQKKLKAGT